MTRFCNTRVNITVKVASKHIKSIRYGFYQSFLLPLEFWNPFFTSAHSAASGLGFCTLHPQCSKRSYARAMETLGKVYLIMT